MKNQNVDTTKTITHISLCSGYEGIGIGLRRVLPNLREIAYVEIEAFPIANLVAKMEEGQLDAAPVFTDVKTFPFAKFRGCVDIISGGFPCQPFSNAGKRQGVEDPRHLFPYIANGIRECQPGIVFLENVEGIISAKTADGESVLQHVLGELEGLGYRATAGIFSAAEVGATHQRKRVFILGMGNSDSKRCEWERLRRDEEESEGSISRGSSEALVNSDTRRFSPIEQPGGSSEEISGGQINIEPSSGSQKLANHNNEGLERYQCNSSTKQGKPIQADTWSASSTRWPARPSEPQHEWEAPRVVADSKGKQGSSRDNGKESRASSQSEEGESGGGDSGSLREANRKTESKLGGAIDGSSSRVDATANRVDRLRLCGNGVVPQTAAKAFITLINRVI